MIDFFNKNEGAFTSIGVLITFLVSSISLYISVKNSKSTQYIDSVTKNRVEWIQELRTKISKFIAKTNIYNNAYYTNDSIKSGLHLSECQQLYCEIELLLNYCDEKDREIVVLCKSILISFRDCYDKALSCKTDEHGFFIENDDLKKLITDVENNIMELTKKVQIYLKSEWNRVKYESKGKIYEKDTQRFDYKELEEKYKDSSYKNKILNRYFIELYAKLKRILCYPPIYIYSMILLISFLIIKYQQY